MANLKKDLLKLCYDGLDEIFDSYEKYSEIDQKKVQTMINDIQELGKSLEHYDQKDVEKKISWFQKNLKKWGESTNAFFGKKK